jgi:hypothetical protein
MCTGVCLRANVRARTCVFAFGSEGFPQRVRAQTGPEVKTMFVTKWARQRGQCSNNMDRCWLSHECTFAAAGVGFSRTLSRDKRKREKNSRGSETLARARRM